MDHWVQLVDQRPNFGNAVGYISYNSKSAQQEGMLVKAVEFPYTYFCIQQVAIPVFCIFQSVTWNFGRKKCPNSRKAYTFRVCLSEISDKVLFDFMDCKVSS